MLIADTAAEIASLSLLLVRDIKEGNEKSR